jgi:hypothetical protein
MNTVKVSRSTLQNIVSAIRQRGDKLTNDHDEVELLAASFALNEEMRGFRPDSTSGRTDAAQTYLRKLPKNDEAARRQLKTDAAAALGEPEILAQFERELEAQRDANEAAARLLRIKQEPIDALLREKMLERHRAAQQRIQDAWNPARFDAMEAAAKRTLLELVGTNAEESPNGSSRIRAAIKDIQDARVLKELALERQGGKS